jgi:hypothetical protein
LLIHKLGSPYSPNSSAINIQLRHVDNNIDINCQTLSSKALSSSTQTIYLQWLRSKTSLQYGSSQGVSQVVLTAR